MGRLSRITSIPIPTRLSSLLARVRTPKTGTVGLTLSPNELRHQKEQLLQQHIALTFQCLLGNLGDGVFAWEVLEKFGHTIPPDHQGDINRRREIALRQGLGFRLLPDDFVIRSKGLSRISPKRKAKVKAAVERLSGEDIAKILFSRDYLWRTALERQKLVKVVIAYHVHENKIPQLLDMVGQDGTARLAFGVEVAAHLISLGRREEARECLTELLREAAPEDCVLAGNFALRNLLLELHELLEDLLPEMQRNKGLILALGAEVFKNPTSKAEDQRVVETAFVYPNDIIEKALPLASPLTKLLLRLGILLFECEQDPISAQARFRDLWHDVEAAAPDVGERVTAQAREAGLETPPPPPTVNAVVPEAPPKATLAPLSGAMTQLFPRIADDDAVALRDRVRLGGRPLLFTRNISPTEIGDMAQSGRIRNNPDSASVFYNASYFRYGLGHEYGTITVIMKPHFWEEEKERSSLKNLLLRKVNGETAPGQELKPLGEEKYGMVMVDGVIEADDNPEGFLLDLTQKVDYNRSLDRTPSSSSWVDGIPARGETIAMPAMDQYMGVYPQLEVKGEVPLEQIEKILVPEHMWDEARQRAKQNPQVAALLHKVERTGTTEDDFLNGSELMARRSRGLGGGFDPMFGYNSFYLFEQEYFRTVLDTRPVLSAEEFSASAQALMQRYRYVGRPSGWLWAYPTDVTPISRSNDGDWKIFVNPREETFLPTLEAVLQILSQNGEQGIFFKIPPDPSLEWRPGRRFGRDPNTPKITIYVNQDTLAQILRALDEHFCTRQELHKAGFGEAPGPSFTRRYGLTDLLFYKKEYAFDMGGG